MHNHGNQECFPGLNTEENRLNTKHKENCDEKGLFDIIGLYVRLQTVRTGTS